MNRTGILECPVAETPIAVIDFETTGLNPGSDRVVEASVVRIEPGQRPMTVFDTLINPRRRMAATEIHGITDEDVADAPEFGDVANTFLDSIAGCVVASYNVYFDIRFLEYELAQTSFCDLPPHLCLMYFRPMLGLGKRCPLSEACRLHDIPYANAHTALADTKAASRLMELYLATLRDQNIRTFQDLARLKTYKFLNSLTQPPLRSPDGARSSRARLKSRSIEVSAAEPARDKPPVAAPTEGPESEQDKLRDALHAYWDALKTVLADMEVTGQEVVYLETTKRQLGLRNEQIRVLHARAFVNAISRFAADRWLDDKECEKLRKLHRCLSRAGWAPGE